MGDHWIAISQICNDRIDIPARRLSRAAAAGWVQGPSQLLCAGAATATASTLRETTAGGRNAADNRTPAAGSVGQRPLVVCTQLHTDFATRGLIPRQKTARAPPEACSVGGPAGSLRPPLWT